MLEDLREKVVLITGASTGIGAAAAAAFAACGSRVLIHYNQSRSAAEDLLSRIRAEGGQVHLSQADLSDPDSPARIIQEALSVFGRLDILINNAGSMVRRCPVEEAGEDLITDVFNLNCRHVVHCIQAALPSFREQGQGNIINTTSIAARHGGGPGAVLYAAAKGFVSTLTRGLARELASRNIRVNAVSPGVIDTPFHERHSSPELLRSLAASVPMGRIGSSQDCAGAFLFLASDQLSGYMTGQILEVNGGQLMP